MRFHPWHHLRDTLAGWSVVFSVLPDGTLGVTDHDTRTITLTPGMTQAQRRATIAHECVHAERPPIRSAAEYAREERIANEQAARRLIPLDELLDALRWTLDLYELAEELWVDVETVRIRLSHLHPSERARVKALIDERPG